MADRSSERDRRVRELLRRKNPGFDVLGQAQAEIQDAQSELYNHVAMQQAQEQSRLRETSAISQAAQGLLAMENSGGVDQLRVQAAQMNPATQATLSRFGVRPSQNSNRNSATQRIVTRTGNTTNIKNETITNNRTEIKVTQPSIPMAQPIIPMRAAASKEDSASKFKAWLSGMFARQQNEAEIQRKEYRKKEWSLGRTTSRLMKRIGEATTNLGNKLDPKNMTTTLGGQLKWLLLIFGATMIAKVWKPAMNFIANLEGGFRAVFGLPMNEDLRNTSSKSLSIIDKIKDAIGIKNKEDSLISGIKDVFFEGIKKLIDRIDFWFEDRKKAINQVKPPKIERNLIGLPKLESTVSEIGQYLGDLVSAAFGGTKGRVRSESEKVQKEAKKEFLNTKGKETSLGDSALATGNGRNYMKESDYDVLGRLKGNASSTQAMSQNLISLFNDTSGKAHTSEIATGVSQLFNTADRTGHVVIDPTLLEYLGLDKKELVNLQQKGSLSQQPYRLIAVNPNDAQKAEMGAYNGHYLLGTGLIGGSLTGAVGGAITGAEIGAAGGPLGMILGGLIGGGLTALLAGGLGAAYGAAGDEIIKRISGWTKKGLYPKLVPQDSKEKSADGSEGITKPLWVLNKDGVNRVKSLLTGGMHNKELKLENEEFYNFIRKRGEIQARKNGIALKSENININNLKIAQAIHKESENEYYNKFKSSNLNSENQKNYGHWNAFSESSRRVADKAKKKALSYASKGLRWAGKNLKSNLSGREVQERASYLIKRLIEEGLSPEQAAGVAGNIMQESGFRADVVNGIGAGGIAQWYKDRRKAIERYHGRDITEISYPEQVEYLIKELKGEVGSEGIKNWGNRGIKFGATEGDTIFDALKKSTSLEQATAIHEFYFERSEDYQNAIRDGVTPYQNRTYYAQEFLKTYSPPLNLDLREDTRISGSKFNGIGWLGDSQSVTSGCSFPVAVKQKMGISIAYFGRVSARPDHYTGSSETHLKEIGTNIPNVESCSQALSWVLENKPKYVIIALGHNGVNGYSTLVNKLKGVGITVIGIKMWKIDKFSSKKMQELYENIKTDKWIDLTDAKIQLSSDGIHATKSGCIAAAEEVTRQLNGFGPSSESGGLLDDVADTLMKFGDSIDPDRSDTYEHEQELTEEQKKAVENYNTYVNFSDQVKFGSLIGSGVKIDNFGAYVDGVNNTRIYLKDSASGLMGKLSQEDIDFVGRINKTGELEEISREEEQSARDSFSVTAASLFSSYQGKGTLTDRFGHNNKKIYFYLGKFKDIENFHEYARKTLGRSGIQFWICPTKDASSIGEIKISPKFRTEFVEGDLFKEEADEFAWVGPIIFDKGRQWFNPWGNKKLTSDLSPAAMLYRVNLTPNATIKARKLFKILSFGEIFEKNGRLYKSSDGTALTEEEENDAKEFGIDPRSGGSTTKDIFSSIKETVHLESGKFKTSEYFKNLGIEFKDRKEFFKKYKEIFSEGKNGEIIGPGGVVWGTGGKENPTFFNEKELKEFNEALGDKGLKENDENNKKSLRTIKYAKLGQVDLNTVWDFFRDVRNVDLGGKDSDLATKIDNKRAAKGGKTYTSATGKIGSTYFSYLVGTDIRGNINEYKITRQDIVKFINDAYKLHLVDNKTVPEFVSARTLKELAEKLAKTSAGIVIKHKYRNDTGLKQLDKLIASEEEKIKVAFNRTSERSQQPTYDLLAKFLLEKRKLVENIDTPNSSSKTDPDTIQVSIVYKDGSREIKKTSDGFYFGKNDKIPKEWIKQINKQIEENQKEIDIEASKKYFKGSGYQNSLDELRKKYLSGELKGVLKDGKLYVNGQLVGTYNTKGLKAGKIPEVINPIGENDLENDDLRQEILGDPKKFFSDETNKRLYYQKYYGALPDRDGSLWVYSKDRRFRTKINLAGEIKKGETNLINESTEAFDGQKWIKLDKIGYVKYDENSGEFKDTGIFGSTHTEEEIKKLAQDKILESLGGISDSLDIQSKYAELLYGNSNKQLSAEDVATNLRNKSLMQQATANAKSQYQIDLLRIIAKKGTESEEDIGSEIDDIDKKYKQEINNALKTNLKNTKKIDNIRGGTAEVKTLVSDHDVREITFGSEGRLWEYKQDEDGKLYQSLLEGAVATNLGGDKYSITYSDGSTIVYNLTDTYTIGELESAGN